MFRNIKLFKNFYDYLHQTVCNTYLVYVCDFMCMYVYLSACAYLHDRTCMCAFVYNISICHDQLSNK